MNINTIIFDIGNTLLDLDNITKIARKATINTMIKQGCDISDINKANEIFEKVIKESVKLHSDIYFLDYDFLHFYYKELNILADKKTIYASLFFYQDVIKSLTTPRQIQINLLTKLRSMGYKLGIITDGKINSTYSILYLLKILPFFDSIVVSEEVGYEKPHNIIFRKSLEELGSNPSNTMFIGDSLCRDVKGGNDIGMITVLLNRDTDMQKIIDITPDYKIDGLIQVLRILEKN